MERKKNKRYPIVFQRAVLFVLCLFFVVGGLAGQICLNVQADEVAEDGIDEVEAVSEASAAPEPTAPPPEFLERRDAWITLPEITEYSYAYSVYDATTGEMLFGNNHNEQVYPASTTKIMTALVVLDHPDYHPDRVITASEYALYSVPYDSSTAGLSIGEYYRSEDLLYALMLPSGNDAACVLAEAYSPDGYIDTFVEEMNKKAKELGANHTNFIDPHGMGGEDHYTTATDMSLITAAALKNQTFQRVVTTRAYSMPPTNMHDTSGWNDYQYVNTNHLLTRDQGYRSDYIRRILGVKTGYTGAAGKCLVSAAETHNGHILIATLFGATEYYEHPERDVPLAARTLLEQGAIRIGAPAIPDGLITSEVALPGSTPQALAPSPETQIQSQTSGEATLSLPWDNGQTEMPVDGQTVIHAAPEADALQKTKAHYNRMILIIVIVCALIVAVLLIVVLFLSDKVKQARRSQRLANFYHDPFDPYERYDDY